MSVPWETYYIKESKYTRDSTKFGDTMLSHNKTTSCTSVCNQVAKHIHGIQRWELPGYAYHAKTPFFLLNFLGFSTELTLFLRGHQNLRCTKMPSPLGTPSQQSFQELHVSSAGFFSRFWKNSFKCYNLITIIILYKILTFFATSSYIQTSTTGHEP